MPENEPIIRYVHMFVGVEFTFGSIRSEESGVRWVEKLW